MGLLCSKQAKSDGIILPRVSPFGRFSRRSSQLFLTRKRFVREDSLLFASLDTLVATLHLLNPQHLAHLPLDLAQLLLDRLIETGKLNDTTVANLYGQVFYELLLDSYPVPIRDFWLRSLISESLQVIDLSRTQVDDFMLSSIPTLPNLRILRLECCEAISDPGLALLYRLPCLEELSLAGCDAIGPLGLGAIGRLTSLRRLNLKACHKVWGLGPLRLLTRLEALDLGWCIAVGNEDAAAIASLSTLRQLSLGHTEFNDAGLGKLSTLVHLTRLEVGGLRMRDATMAALVSVFTELRVLSMERCEGVGDLTAHALRSVSLCSIASASTATASTTSTTATTTTSSSKSPLEDLDLSYTRVTDEGLAALLPHLTRLVRLNLDSCHVGDDSLCHLHRLPSLQTLDASDTRVGQRSFTAIGRCPRLTQLNLSFTEVNDWGLEKIARATGLRRLNLDSRHVGDVGMRHVAALPHLEALDLFGSAVTDVGCVELAKATRLTSLEVCSGAVTDTGVAHLATLPALKHLSLSQNWRVTNSAIPALMRLSGLTALNLSVCRVTSSAVVTLGCLPQLQVLALAGTRVRPAAVEKLQGMKADLEVRGVAMPY